MNSNRTTILLISNHPNVQSPIETFAANYADEFVLLGTATTGAEGVKTCAEHLPDVVLVDGGLYDMVPVDIVKQVKTVSPASIVIGMSHSNAPDFLRTMMQAGTDSFLTKPLIEEYLVNTIRSELKKKSGKEAK